jgi:hypothetical protein
MTLTPQDFVSKWKRAEARERQKSILEQVLEKLLALNLERVKG